MSPTSTSVGYQIRHTHQREREARERVCHEETHTAALRTYHCVLHKVDIKDVVFSRGAYCSERRCAAHAARLLRRRTLCARPDQTVRMVRACRCAAAPTPPYTPRPLEASRQGPSPVFRVDRTRPRQRQRQRRAQTWSPARLVPWREGGRGGLCGAARSSDPLDPLALLYPLAQLARLRRGGWARAVGVVSRGSARRAAARGGRVTSTSG